MTNVFKEIYLNNSWGNAESHSGHGSSASATRFIRDAFPAILQELGVKSIVDVPCGDFNWMRLLDLPLDYFGADIVQELIEKNQKNYSRSGRAFGLLDVTKEPLPKADLVFSRDLLVHLSETDIRSALKNIYDSGAKYLVTTTFTSRDKNVDIPTGLWRTLNLQRPPFSFPPPIRLINERCEEGDGLWADKCLGVWEVNVLRAGEAAAWDAARVARPRVSIIIPNYNRADFIGEAVASALGQDYQAIEVIVIDDGSPDDTSALLATFRDPRVVRMQKEDAGRALSLNRAVAFARGKYVAFLDPSDYYLPSKTGTQVAFLDANPEVGMVYMSSAGVNDDRLSYMQTSSASGRGRLHSHVSFVRNPAGTISEIMIRKEIIEQIGWFDEKMKYLEDIDLVRRVSKVTRIAGLEEVGVHLRANSKDSSELHDPEFVASAIDGYVKKVSVEDKDMEPITVAAGIRHLYEMHGRKLLSENALDPVGTRLLDQGRPFFEPKVSIVIPVYNGANYLSLAIHSALAQTYRNIEIIVVNDGSDDNGATARIAQMYGDRIRYFEKENGGVASALNLAIREAKGQFISWLSHDDLYTLDKIDRQISFLTEQSEPNRCVIYGDYSVFYNTSTETTGVSVPTIDSADFRYFITVQNLLHGCTLLLPKSAFDKHGLFDESLRTTQDYDFWFRIAENFNFIHLPGIVVKSRLHEEQGTRKLRDVALAEANNLLSRFAENLTDEQIRRGSGLHPYLGYHAVAESFYARGFDAAGDRATQLAAEKLRALARDDAAADELNRALASRFRESKTAENESGAKAYGQAEIARLKLELDEIRSSMEWKIGREATRPFRRIGRSRSDPVPRGESRPDMAFKSTPSKIVREVIRPFVQISRSLSRLV